MARRLTVVVVTCAIAVAIAATSPARAAEPSKAESAVIDAAAAALKREYAAHLKSPDASPLRARSTFFLENPPASEIPAEAVVAGLERPVSNDPRLTAYVRWQLLSAVPKPFGDDPAKHDPKLMSRVLEAYRRAPLPPPRFGLSPQDQAVLDAALTGTRKEDDAALSAKLEERAAAEAAANAPILAYRDALYERLPKGYESLLAGLQDAHDRASVAAGGGTQDAHAARVVKDAQAWAQSGQADPRQCARLVEVVARLRHVRSPPYYARATLRRGADKLSWSTKTDAVYSPKKLSDLEKVLRDAQKLGQAQKSQAQKAAQAQKAQRPAKR